MSACRFQIVDSSKRRAVPCAILVCDSKDDVRIEISESATANDVPAFFIPFLEKGERLICGDLALRWLRERIVPPGRQNLGEVLKAAGLNEYDEIELLRAGRGKSSHDSFLVHEIGPSEDAALDEDVRTQRRANLGSALKARRIGKGLSQKELADRVSMKQPALSKIESGIANPTFDTLADLDDSLEAHGNRIVDTSRGFLWNERRETVFALLLEQWPDLAYIYERIVNELGGYDPSNAAAVMDSMVIAHGLRELMNSAPKCFGGLDDVGSAFQKEERAREAVEAALDSLDVGGLKERIAADASIGGSLNEKIAAWADARHEGTFNNQSKASQALYGDPKRPGTAVKGWVRSQGFAHERAHYHRSMAQRRHPSRAEYLHVLGFLEDVIYARFGVALDAKHRLQNAIAKANRVTAAGDYGEPSEADVRGALALGAMNGLEPLLFSELRNPKWLKVLEDQGVFRQYADDVKQGKNPDYPAFAPYLARCAPVAPDDVCNILKRLLDIEHPSFAHVALDCASGLPESHLARVGEMAERAFGWKSRDGASVLFDPQQLAGMLRRMLGSQDDMVKKKGKRLLAVAIELTQVEEHGFYAPLSALIDEYEYREFFDTSTADLSDVERLDLARTALVNGIRLRNEHAKNRDASFQIVGSLSDEDLSASEETSFLAALAAICKEIVGGNTQDFWGSLRQIIDKKPPIMQRIAFQVLHERLLANADEGVPGTAAYGLLEDIVSKDFLFDSEYQKESLPLLADYGARATEESLASFFGQLDERSAANRQRLSRRFEGSSREHIDAVRWAIMHTEKAEHRILQQFKEGRLPPEKLRRLRAYERKHGGPMEEPRSMSVLMSIGWGKSTVSADTLALMKRDDLFSYLNGWTPSQADLLNFVTREGLASELSAMVEMSPFAFNGCLDELERLHPVYVRGVFDGWGNALRNAREIPLHEAILLAHWAVMAFGAEDASSEEADGGVVSERYQTKRAAAWFIEEVVERCGDAVDASTVSQIVEIVNELSKGDVDDPGNEDGDYADEASLQATGNRVRLIAISISLKALSNCPSMTGTSREVLHRIVRSAMPTNTESEADVFALALGCGGLFECSQGFLEENKAFLLGGVAEDALQQKLLSLMLFVLNPHSRVIEFLREPVETCLEADPHHVASFEIPITKKGFMHALGDWLCVGIFWGTIGLDDPLLRRWLSLSSGKEKGAALMHVGQGLAGLSNPESLSEERIERVKALWDCVDEGHGDEPGAVRGLLDLAETGRFDPAWLRGKMVREAQGDALMRDLARHDDAFLKLAEGDPKWGMRLIESVPEGQRTPPPLFSVGRLSKKLIGCFVAQGGSKEDPDLASFMNWVARGYDLNIDEYVAALG